MNDPQISNDTVTTGIKAAYDAVDYECTAYPQSHPDRLRTVARMFGVDAPPVATARVLEVGCGDGSNLIPVADAYPQATFVGCDLAPRAIDAGNALIAAAGLRNVELRCQDLRELPPSLGEFDYVIAHGFYSWVPAPVRDALMQLLASRMSANGVAFISYNTHPGNRIRQMGYDAMNWHTRNSLDAIEKLRASRELLRMMAMPSAAQWKPDDAVRAEFSERADFSDSALFHDDLAQPNDPCYFHEFAAHAQRHGLAYLADTDIRMMSGAGLAADVRKFVLSFGRLEREQYIDFMRLRRFRQSLLTRGKSSSDFSLIPARILDMQIGAASTLMRSMDRAVQAGNPRESVVKASTAAGNAMLLWLAGLFPRTVSAADVAQWRAASASDDTRPLEIALTEAYVSGSIDLFSQPVAVVAEASERPRASRIARLQARSRPRVVSLRHESVNLNDPFAYRLLPLLDGTKDRAVLQRELGPDFDRGSIGFDAILQFFAKVSLLVA